MSRQKGSEKFAGFAGEREEFSYLKRYMDEYAPFSNETLRNERNHVL